MNNSINAAAQVAGKAYNSAKEAAGKAYSAAKAAFKDACPGTSFQHKNDRTSDGMSLDPTGTYKVCEEKRLFGPNDPPFYVDETGAKKSYTGPLSGRKMRSKKRSHSHKKHGASHKKRGHSHKKRGHSHKKRGHKKRSASRK
jgi:hypothetical protein